MIKLTAVNHTIIDGRGIASIESAESNALVIFMRAAILDFWNDANGTPWDLSLGKSSVNVSPWLLP